MLAMARPQPNISLALLELKPMGLSETTLQYIYK
jgi:hypothetical protein